MTNSPIDLSALNPQQREAVLHREGPMLLLAGAGSGKTRVATVRIAHLVGTGVSPDQILAVTFTNKAAKEMAERASHLVHSDQAKSLTICTFHKLGVSILREHGPHVGVPKGFAILDASDQVAAVTEAMRACRLDMDRYDPRWMLSRISAAKNDGKRPEDLGLHISDVVGQIVREVYTVYQKSLEELGGIDFDDLILRPLQLFENHADVLQFYRHRFPFVLVDEFQDTNGVQFRLIQLLGGARANVFAVGDDDQSIYGWRGAQVKNIWEFEKRFPGARVLALEQNYRSTGTILDAANAVIRRNAARRDKRMWTADQQGVPIRFVRLEDPDAEAEFVAREIKRRVESTDSDQRPASDFGILIRTNMQARPLEEALRQSGLPYHLVGAFSFYDRKEVRDAIAHFRLIAHPSDELSARRALGFPSSGVGPASLAKLRERAVRERRAFGDMLIDSDARRELPTRAQKGCEALGSLLQHARERLARKAPLAATLRSHLEELRFPEAIRAEAKSAPEAKARWRNVQFLLRNIEVYESRRGPESNLVDYLRGLSLEQKDDEPPPDALTVMTLHAAKGLEFPCVFLCGVEEGIIPHQRSIDAGDVDEERRLFYVGVTRARNELSMTACHRRSRNRTRRVVTVSRFVDEIPEELVVRDDRGLEQDPGDVELRRRAFDKIADIFK